MSQDTLWYTRCPVPTASGIAIQLGWIDDEFEPDGITARSLASSSRPEVREAHYMLSSTDLFRHGGNTPPLIAASKDVDHRFLAFSWTDTSYPVLALPESGIETAADLKGKRLSLPRRPNDKVDFFNGLVLRVYEHALATAGLTLDDVDLVEITTERPLIADANQNTTQRGALWGAYANATLQREEALALARGEVDAIASEAAIGASLAATLRLRTVIDTGLIEGASNNSLPLVLSVSGELLDREPELVTRWLARVLDAVEWARENELEAKRILAAEAGIAEDFVQTAYGASVHEQLDLVLDDRSLAGLKAQHDHLLRLGYLDRAVDVESLIDPAPLAAAHELRSRQRVGA